LLADPINQLDSTNLGKITIKPYYKERKFCCLEATAARSVTALSRKTTIIEGLKTKSPVKWRRIVVKKNLEPNSAVFVVMGERGGWLWENRPHQS